MAESVRRTIRRRFGSRVGGFVTVLLLGVLLAPASANATWTAYRQEAALCDGCQDADVTRTALTASAVSTSDPKYVQAGAHQPGGWTLSEAGFRAWVTPATRTRARTSERWPATRTP
jgi:hypothetical protein